MSLRADEGRRRTRSKSPGRPVDDREDRYERPAYDTRESSYAYPEDDLDDYPRRRVDRRDRPRDDDSRAAPVRESSGGLPYPESTALVMPGAFDDERPPATYRKASPPSDSPYRSSREKVDSGRDERRPTTYRNASPPADSPYRSSREKVDSGRDSRVRFSEYGDEGARGSERPVPFDADERFKHLPQKYSKAVEKSDKNRDDDRRPLRQRPVDENELTKRAEDYDEAVRSGRRRDDPRPAAPSYREARKARMEEDLAYGASPDDSSPPRRSMRKMLGFSQPEEELIDKFGYPSHDNGPPPDRKSNRPAYDENPRQSSSNMLTVDPGSRVRDSSRDRRGSSRRDRSPQPPTAGMSMLSVDAARPTTMSLANAPPSPLLESYHGTYQQSSPMPSPMLLAQPSGGVVDVRPLNSDDDRSADEKRVSLRARFHDPEEIAARIANALRGDHRAPDTEPLLQILPGISHEEVMELRTQYKAIVKAGSSRKGVNVAKHIRSRLRDEDPNLMKACYAVALGQWESEAYWANFWYQGDKTRRELLIESLMGRTNEEIQAIKNGFSDKKYGDSLTKCMKTELKEDKFKKAVMLTLSEERMEEEDEYGRPLAIDTRLVEQDADDLRRAIESEKGGESLMISIVVLRSDSHLREVLKEYSQQYRSNFARDALKKSTNLVGEVLAHILNGVINKPVRDALLLHHALTASRKDDLRHELLTSRLVRYHWDRLHMEAVKRAYAQRYGVDLSEAVREATSGEWGLFCGQLCIARTPNDVKQVARLSVGKPEKERGKSRERSSTLEVGGRERGKSRDRRGDTLEVGGRERGKSRSRSRSRRRE